MDKFEAYQKTICRMQRTRRRCCSIKPDPLLLQQCVPLYDPRRIWKSWFSQL